MASWIFQTQRIFFYWLFFLYRKFHQHKGQTQPKQSFFQIIWHFFPIYGNDGDTISTRGVIINIKKYRWGKVPENSFVGIRMMILFISNSWSCFLDKCFLYPHLEPQYVFFQPHSNRGVKVGYQILSWEEIQTQVIHALSTIISYLPRSNVPWCPTLELLSQTRFLPVLSGSYDNDRKMIINIRNELPSSCLGSLRNKLNW